MSTLPQKVIACEVVLDAMAPFLPEGVTTETIPMSLHVNPGALRLELQDRIDASDGLFDPIVLGFGLCSQATVGLSTAHSRLVITRTDDCIGIFLGSRDAYRSQLAQQPGTYFLTRGWAGVENGTPFAEFERAKQKWGEERAQRLLDSMLKHYRRLVYINTPGESGSVEAHDYAQDIAQQFSLQYEELDSQVSLIDKLINGPWDGDCMVIEPGEQIQLESFLR